MTGIRLKRFFTILILLFVKYLIFVIIVAYSPALQSFLAKQATEFLTKRFDIDLSIQKIYIKIPNQLVLNDVLLKDQNKDTLLSSNEINVKISRVKLFGKELFIDEVNILKPEINAIIDTNGIANYSYLFGKFSSDKEKKTEPSSGKSFDIFLNDFKITDANLKYKNLESLDKNKGFDMQDLDIYGINLTVNNFKYQADTIELNIKDFHFEEQSGFNVKEMSTYFKYYNSGIILKDFIFETNSSIIKSSRIELIGKDKDYLSDLKNKLSVNIDLDSIIFDVADLAPFLPEYKNLHDKVYLSGNFTGKLSNIKIKDFNIMYGSNTKLNANISIDGLPDYDLAFIFGNISTFTTSSTDIAKILHSVSPSNPINLPNAVSEIGNISFTGNITGLLNDAVAYGQFETGLGNIRTDLAIATDFDKKKLGFNGKIKATDVNLGKITGDTVSFGFASLNTSLKGDIDSLGNFNIQVGADIDNIGLLGYDYSGININGLVSNDLFDGELNIDDPNLKVEFLGKYNYGSKNKEQEINFTTDIWANLSNLNIVNDSLNSEIKLVMSTDIIGDFSSLPSGNIHISQLSYTMNDQPIKLNFLNVNSYKDESDQQYITVRSDYLDLNLYGEFAPKEIINIATSMVSNYLPAFIDKPEPIEITRNNNVNYDLRFKNINSLLQAFMPDFNIKDDIFIEGMFSGKDSILNTILSIPVLVYDSIYIWGNEIDLYGYKDSLNLSLSSQEVSTSKAPLLENLNIKFDAKDDNTLLGISWNNYDTMLNAGALKIHTHFTKKDTLKLPTMENTIFPTDITVNNSVWNVNESDIIFNPNNLNLKIDNFLLSHKNQSISVTGEVSDDKTKILRFGIDNVDISNINSFISNSGYQINGILSGNGRVADVFGDPSFRGFIGINDFKINDEDFGIFELSANWDGPTNGFQVDGNNKYLRLKGFYTPEDDKISISFNADNFKLEILEPYLNAYDLSELRGTVDIDIDVSGSVSNPDVAGFVKFTKAQLVYDFLKLKVFLDEKVEITKNSFLFKDFKIVDENKNTGVINGGIYHNNFKNTRFDFNIDADNMKLLNTTEKDNSTYYGTVFATANGKIYGDLKKLNIDVVAKTEPNTLFVLPMSNTYEGGSVGFITFIKPQTDSTDVSYIQPIKSGTDIIFKMDVEVTQSAEAQIVFDPKVGDVIKGYTNGNLKLEYNGEEESFNMYGNLEIVEGDYLFTLENIINKKLTVKPGGTIAFSGNPLDAIVDLNAVYQTRAPLKELMAEYNDSTENYSKLTNVECLMHMTGRLMSPDIKFNIEIPNASEKVKAQLANMSQDDINKQMIFLLVTNRFYASSQSGNSGSDMGTTTNAVGVTTFELLSNQISNWLSQISKDFDIGFKYYPGSEVTGQELELALSTQILNDKVLINGNFAYGEDNRTNTNSSMLGGDIEVQLKVNKSGSFRIKGFSRANRDVETEYGPYTSGAGVFYTKDFDKVGELFSNFWKTITFRNYRDKKKAKNVKAFED